MIRYPMRTGVSEPVVLRRESVEKLNQTKAQFTAIAVTDRWMHFRNGEGLTLACPRVLDQYPDLSRYLAMEGRPFRFPDSMTRNAVEFAQAFLLSEADERNRLVRIDIRPGAIVLRSGREDRSSRTFPHDYQGESLTFFIPGALLMHMLDQELTVSRTAVRFHGEGFQLVARLGSACASEQASRKNSSARRGVLRERVVQKPPFQYFGGKRKVAQEVWRRFGDVDNYIEPFFGSGAVLFGRKHWADRIETVNDIDDHLTNFWRAAKADPEGLAKHVDHPVSETDLLVRNRWLMDTMKERASWLKGDPDYYDVKAAAWWVWGISQWIGSGFCDSRPSTKLPHIGGPGMGIHRRRLHSKEALLEYFTAIATRLRSVRICCGDWTRVLGESTTTMPGTTGIVFDPPYLHETADSKKRTKGIYVHDDGDVAFKVRGWCLEHGDDPRFRIALCGYTGEHEMPNNWTCFRWRAQGGYGNQGNGKGRQNAGREAIWFSPHCNATVEFDDDWPQPV